METPPRNFRNELLVAVIALVMLGSAVGLAAVLTGAPTDDSVGITPTAASMGPTEVPATVAPTLPPTEPPTSTEPPTAIPTEVPTEAPTNTEAPPPTPTAAPTEAASPTEEPTPRPTRTRVPSLTPAPTDTVAPSPTLVPTLPPTATATLPPTATDSPTPRPTRTPVPQLVASSTLVPSPTPTATIVLATPITPTAYTCTPPSNWQPYTIRPGDNLFRISLRAGLPLQEIQRVNCIPNAASIEAGTILYVPPTFFAGSSSSTGVTTTDTTTSSIPRVVGCSAVGSQIAAPSAGAVVTGRFTVVGSATLDDRNDQFNFYKLELRGEEDAGYSNVGQSTTPVISGTLGTVNTANFGPGHYQLKLTVVDETGNYIEPCAIRLTFR